MSLTGSKGRRHFPTGLGAGVGTVGVVGAVPTSGSSENLHISQIVFLNM